MTAGILALAVVLAVALVLAVLSAGERVDEALASLDYDDELMAVADAVNERGQQ